MQTRIIIITSLLCILSLLADAKVPVLYNAHRVYDVVDVNLTDTATILTMEVKAKWEMNALTAKPHLSYLPKTRSTFKHGYIDKKGERESLSLDSKVNTGDKVVMFFETLPDSIKVFNYFEGQNFYDEVHTISGIRVDGESYHSINLPPVSSERRNRLPAYETKVDTAILSVDFNMPILTSSNYAIRNNQWSDSNWGYYFDIDSLSRSKVSGSYVNMLPTTIYFTINNRNYPWVATPGSKTRIIFDAPGYSEAIENGASESEAFNQAFKIYDAPLPEIYTAPNNIDFRWYFNSKFGDIPIKAYSDSLRNQLQQRKEKISEKTSLSGAEREYLELFVEKRYIDELTKLIQGKTNPGNEKKEDLVSHQDEPTLLDPLAHKLLFASSPAAIYLTNDDEERKEMADYLKANGLNDSPFVRTVDYYFNAVDSIKQANAKTKANELLGIRENPDCKPSEILETIIKEHQGKTVLIDFWATWCGPCMMGMKQLEPFKEELSQKGVDFIYITDESSPFKAWENIIPNHKGSHYRLPQSIFNEMNIPGYKGSIPHYLIYKSDGTLSTAISGWEGVNTMLENIAKAQAELTD